MPLKGRDREWLEKEWKGLKKLEKGDVDSGRVSGTVYHVSLDYKKRRDLVARGTRPFSAL